MATIHGVIALVMRLTSLKEAYALAPSRNSGYALPVVYEWGWGWSLLNRMLRMYAH
jgi:hypothetical protein